MAANFFASLASTPTILIDILTICAFLLYFFWWRRPHSKFPPGPRGLPLLGVMPFLGKRPSVTLKKWSLEKYGPVMSVRLGRDDVVVLNDFEAINQALVKQGSLFSDRPRIELFYRVTKRHGMVRKSYTDEFKTQKNFALKFLKEKGLGKQEMEKVLNDEGDKFIAFLKNFEGTPVNLKKHLYWLTSNVISKIALGRRHEYGDTQFSELLDALSLIFSDPVDSPRLSAILLFGVLVHFPPFSGAMRNFEERHRVIMDQMQKYIERHRADFDADNVDDFIAAFLYEQKFNRHHNAAAFTDKELSAFCRDLFLAGSETSSTALSWLFVFVQNYPDHYNRVREEIREVLGTSGTPSMSHREQMPFTCAFVNEVMRVRTLAPLTFMHSTSSTVQLHGYVIPKGTKVLPNLEGVHMDPNDWSNPDVFNPLRHIDRSGRFVPSKKIMPFGAGARLCLGESLARAEVFMFFVKLLQRFDVRPAKGRPPPVDSNIVNVIFSPQECDVILTAI